MKKKLSYFNAEERNGLYLLSFMLFVFSTFIFLQMRVLPSNSNITIVQNTLPNENQVDRNINDGNFMSKPNLETQSLISHSLSKNNPVKSKKMKKEIVGYKETTKKATKHYDKKNDPIVTQNKETKKREKVVKKSSFVKSKEKISINSQNMDEWMSLYGIGPKYAERIIKYQTWLGGFHKKEQLMEVYGITDTLFQSLEAQLLPSEPYTLIKINEVEVKDLARHPYIDWKLAKMIINYRKHHKPFLDENDLRKMKGLQGKTLMKILPYIDFSVKLDESNS